MIEFNTMGSFRRAYITVVRTFDKATWRVYGSRVERVEADGSMTRLPDTSREAAAPREQAAQHRAIFGC